jgi:Fic family protein
MTETETLLQHIDELKIQLDALRSELDNAAIRDALKIEFLYESNRIEGNTLTLRETQLVIQEGMTISGKSLREHLEAINQQEAILFVEDIVARKEAFTESILKQVHALVLHGIDRENAGQYLRVPVLIVGSSHIPPQPFLLQPLMEEYFVFYTAHH